jgi:hypothetical protein
MTCTNDGHARIGELGPAAVRNGRALLLHGLRYAQESLGEPEMVSAGVWREALALLPEGTCAECLRVTLVGAVSTLASMVAPERRDGIIQQLGASLLAAASDAGT